MLRRQWLQALLTTTVIAACGGDDEGDAPASPSPLATSPADRSNAAFPQGVASGDPTPGSVILWTRVEPAAVGQAATAAIAVDYVIATDEALTAVVKSGTLQASPEADHTVRLRVEGLQPGTRYHYRFAAAGVTTQVGRTKTAPAADADQPVSFVFASCQDYIGRRYHAWFALITEKIEVDFVLFLGDYIYESTGDASFQVPDEERKITLPEGLALAGSNRVAVSLADYRHLYKTYRSDPHLREVHRLFPFITLWDDHEFANDCWQDRANDFNGVKGDEKSTPRREAASRAWAEFQPADVPRDGAKGYPDDIKIYRSLRFGKHVELFATDQRSYRSDHLIPEGPEDLDVGKFEANSSLGSRNFLLKKGFDAKETAASPKPTMLGAEQKSWFLGALKASNATWKVWANEVQLWQMALDLSSFKALPEQYQDKFYFNADQWDGYRSERAEVLSALAGVDNVVACTGDIHAFFAAELHTDFDNPGPTPVAVEFVTAGISSMSAQDLTKQAVAGNAALSALGLLDLIPKFDEILTGTNPYLVYSKGDSYGLAVATVSAAAFEVEFLHSNHPTSKELGGFVQRVKLRTASGSRKIEKA